MYEPFNNISLINWPPNSNAKFLTIQNVYVSSEASCSYSSFLRGDWSSHKNYMGEYQNNLTHHGQYIDNVGSVQVLNPINHHHPTIPQYLDQ